MKAFLIKWRVLLAFLVVFLAFIYVGNQNRVLGLDNQDLTNRVRDSQYKGCVRTNTRTDETNKILVSLYNVALGAAQASGDKQAEAFVLSQQKAFSGLTKTDCNKAYPQFSNNADSNRQQP